MTPARALALLAAGIFIGALGLFIVLQALGQRHAVPHGLMNLTQYHYTQNRKVLARSDCDLAQAASHAQQLAALSRDVVPVFAVIGIDEPGFRNASTAYQQAIQDALATNHCDAMADAWRLVGDACQSCHVEYR